MRTMTTALGAVVAALLAAVPAAAVAQYEGDVEFAYEAPEISEEGDHVTWHWTMQNKEDHPVSKVVMTHRLTPAVPVTYVSSPCEVVGDAVKCRWETLKPGEEVEGTIEADLPEELTGSVNVKGRVVWQNDGPAPEPAGTPEPAPVPVVTDVP